MEAKVRTIPTCLGLASGNEQRQVSTLLYCLGEQAEDVLSSTGISVDSAS